MNFNQIYKENKRLIQWFIIKYQQPDHADDLHQHGMIGMNKAIETYSTDKGSFRIWLYIHIKKEMISYLNQNSRTVRLPKHIIEDKERESLPTEFMISLDHSIYDDGDPLYSTIEILEDDKSLNDSQEAIRSLLRHYLNELIPEYQKIIIMHLNEDMTFLEISKILGCTKQNVQQKYQKAIKILQQKFAFMKEM